LNRTALLNLIYVDKLEGVVDKHFYQKLPNQWRLEQSRVHEQIGRHQSADESYLTTGAQLLDVACHAHITFDQREPNEKRRMLNCVLSNSKWMNGRLTPQWRKPFDLIAKMAMQSKAETARSGSKSTEHMVWLPGPDSNQRPTG
jgi:hypothetical protein